MIRLLNLSIQAFRGVREILNVDISKPVTIIYAPNGTGKTTICDAAEWLLTAEIKRLAGRNASDMADIRCALSADSLATRVFGSLEIDGQIITIERGLDSLRWKQGTGKFKKISTSKLLEELAPSAAELGTYGKHTASSRKTWLRGNRFLSAENLSTLLDFDEGAVANRQQLFADLLGVGHLLEAELQLRVLSKLSRAVDKQTASFG